MGYDYSVGEAGPIAPIDWVRGAVRAAKDAVDDDDKLVAFATEMRDRFAGYLTAKAV